jgi:hypothetical protein
MIECIFVVQICCYSKCGVVLEELNPHLPLAFWLSSHCFPHHSKCDLDYHILQLHVSFNACAHIPLMLQVSTFYVVPMAMSAEHSWCSPWHFCCHCMRCQLQCGTRTTTPIFFNNIPFLSSTSWCCVHQKWNLHLNRCCHCQSNMSGFILLILCN